MKMCITITPLSNIDWEQMMVIDNDKNSQLTKDWDEEIVIKKHGVNAVKKPIKVSTVSFFEDILIHEGEEYKMLHGFSKED